jgi:c-di-GMP-binding flagellar brake protein YcgR
LRPARRQVNLGFVSSPDITSRLTVTGQLLVRSGIEIGRLLDAMLEERATLAADLPSQVMFLSHLLEVEPVKGYLRLAYGDYKAANGAALAVPRLTLRCNHRGAQFAFTAEAPQAVIRDGQPCIQCGMPSVMLAIQQRRNASRVAVPLEAPIDCDLRMGPQSFVARVVDVSLDGIGTLVSDPTIPLCAGTRIERARIRHPQHPPIEVDLEIRHVTRVRLPNGEQASRVGCKIVSSPAALEELIRLFIIDLR